MTGCLDVVELLGNVLEQATYALACFFPHLHALFGSCALAPMVVMSAV